jgi:hypothetical protein
MLVSISRAALIPLMGITALVHPPGRVLPSDRANSIRSILESKVVYKPEGQTALEQLINIGTRFHVPMGIEWVDDPGRRSAGASPIAGHGPRFVSRT